MCLAILIHNSQFISKASDDMWGFPVLITEDAESRAAYGIRHVFIVIQWTMSHSSLNHNENMPYPVWKCLLYGISHHLYLNYVLCRLCIITGWVRVSIQLKQKQWQKLIDQIIKIMVLCLNSCKCYRCSSLLLKSKSLSVGLSVCLSVYLFVCPPMLFVML